jgi:hypothetical protein
MRAAGTSSAALTSTLPSNLSLIRLSFPSRNSSREQEVRLLLFADRSRNNQLILFPYLYASCPRCHILSPVRAMQRLTELKKLGTKGGKNARPTREQAKNECRIM